MRRLRCPLIRISAGILDRLFFFVFSSSPFDFLRFEEPRCVSLFLSLFRLNHFFSLFLDNVIPSGSVVCRLHVLYVYFDFGGRGERDGGDSIGRKQSKGEENDTASSSGVVSLIGSAPFGGEGSRGGGGGVTSHSFVLPALFVAFTNSKATATKSNAALKEQGAAGDDPLNLSHFESKHFRRNKRSFIVEEAISLGAPSD